MVRLLRLLLSAEEMMSNGVLVMRMDDAERGIDRLRQWKGLGLDRELLGCVVLGFVVDVVVLVMMTDDAARD